MNQDISATWFCIPVFIILAGLCLVRRMELFAKTHVFADLMIIGTMLVIVIYGFKNIELHLTPVMVPAFDPNHYTNAVGLSSLSIVIVALT